MKVPKENVTTNPILAEKYWTHFTSCYYDDRYTMFSTEKLKKLDNAMSKMRNE